MYFYVCARIVCICTYVPYIPIHVIHTNTYQYIQYGCIFAHTSEYWQYIQIRIDTDNTNTYLPIRIYVQYMQYTPIRINTCNTYAYVYTYNTYQYVSIHSIHSNTYIYVYTYNTSQYMCIRANTWQYASIRIYVHIRKYVHNTYFSPESTYCVRIWHKIRTLKFNTCKYVHVKLLMKFDDPNSQRIKHALNG